MPTDLSQFVSLDIPAVEQAYTQRDASLYALSLGFGHDPTDERALRYIYEKDQHAFPTMALTLGTTPLSRLVPQLDHSRTVHYEQSLAMVGRLPPSGQVVTHTRIADVFDRGEGRGALIDVERRIADAATGETIATAVMTALCRADGGFGGRPRAASPGGWTEPSREADATVEYRSSPDQALLYRLNGDMNPIHIDPAAAAKAGFERPLLHGLATFGMVARAVVETMLDGDEERLATIGGRFKGPFLPGETLRVMIWRAGDRLLLRAISVERSAIVFDNGTATGRAAR